MRIVNKIGLFMVLALGLFILVLVLGSNVNGTTITVDDDVGADYEKIQDAIDNATDGDTVRVYEGYYEENIVVNKSINLMGNGSEITTIDGLGSSRIMKITANNVTFNGFALTNGSTGIAIYSNETIISNNHFSTEYASILLKDSMNNTIFQNYCFSRRSNGISLLNSMKNSIISNDFVDCGIYIKERSFNHWYMQNISENNTINGKPVVYLKDENGKQVEKDTGQIILVNCTEIMIENQNCSNGSIGISVIYSTNITLKNNKIHGNKYDAILSIRSVDVSIFNGNFSFNDYFGIRLIHCMRTTVYNNSCYVNFQGGIALWETNYSHIENNYCYGNSHKGIEIYYSNNNTVFNNTCQLSWVVAKLFPSYGIVLTSSNSNSVHNNSCTYNLEYGIGIISSESNSIKNNICKGNPESGIYIESSSHNGILKNDCSNNDYGIMIIECESNTISENIISDNRYGIYFYACLYHIVQSNLLHNNGIIIKGGGWENDMIRYRNSHIIGSTNLVNNKPIYYFSNYSDIKIPNDAGQIILINCTDVGVDKHVLNNTSIGVLIGFCTRIIISNVNCSFNEFSGILVDYSDNISISHSVFLGNAGEGISMINSHYNNISNNNCTGNGIGLYLRFSRFNDIMDCIINLNDNGVQFYYSSNNTIQGSEIFNNEHGILVGRDSNDIIISYNEIYGNEMFGIQNGDDEKSNHGIIAEFNWWGSETGPYHHTNLEGKGNDVSKNVDFRPWLHEDGTVNMSSSDDPHLSDGSGREFTPVLLIGTLIFILFLCFVFLEGKIKLTRVADVYERDRAVAKKEETIQENGNCNDEEKERDKESGMNREQECVAKQSDRSDRLKINEDEVSDEQQSDATEITVSNCEEEM